MSKGTQLLQLLDSEHTYSLLVYTLCLHRSDAIQNSDFLNYLSPDCHSSMHINPEWPEVDGVTPVKIKPMPGS